MDDDSKFYDCHKRLKTAQRVLAEAPIAPANRLLIQTYLAARRSEGIGTWQIIKTLYHLVELARILQHDFREADRDALADVISTIESRPYAAWTKSDYKTICKRFYRWLRDTEEYPPEVRWIKARVVGAQRKLPDELLTGAEISRMVQHADFGRDRALIMALWESGCRVGEIGQLLLRHVEFDQNGARLIVRGKTGMRRMRVVRAAHFLKKWLAVHPGQSDPDAPLWVGLAGKNKHRILTRDAISRVLERAARRAGIRKRIHPHLFRHSRATDLAAQLTEAQLKEMFGWAPGSGQAATYVHLSGRNVDEAVLRTYHSSASDGPQPSKRAARSHSLSLTWDVFGRLLQDRQTRRFLSRRARALGLCADASQ